MPLLESFLALALTMLSFAMIATMIVEVIQRLLRTRSKDLRVMLEAYYDEELKPRFEEELGAAVESAERARQKFIDELLENPLAGRKQSFWHALVRPRRFIRPAIELSTEDLLKKLANSTYGRKLKEKSEREIDEAVDSLAVAYDKFGNAASDIFKRRSQLVSLGAGLLVAFVLNVNALVLLRGFMHDPVLRATLVSKAEQITRDYEESVRARQRPAGPAAAAERAEELKDEVKASLSEISAKVDELEEAGIAFGWRDHTSPKKYWIAPPEGESGYGAWQKLSRSVIWFLGVVGTGLLIGLGCPFWYNLVTKITAVLRTVRGGGGAAKAESAVASLEDSLKPYRDLFKMAGGAPLEVKLRTVESAIRAAAADLREAEEALAGDRWSRGKADIVSVLEQVLERELGKRRHLLEEAQAKGVMPAGGFEDAGAWEVLGEPAGPSAPASPAPASAPGPDEPPGGNEPLGSG